MRRIPRYAAALWSVLVLTVVLGSSPALAVPPVPVTKGSGATALAFRDGTGIWFAYNLDGDPVGVWSRQQLPGPNAYSDPALARDAAGTGIAVQGPSNSLSFYWNLHGNPAWTYQQAAGPGTVVGTPAIVRDGTKTVITAVDIQGLLYSYTNTHGNPTWVPQLVAAEPVFGSPSMARHGTTTVIAARGEANSMYYFWKADGASNWSSYLAAQPGSVLSDPSIARDATATSIVFRNWNNGLTYLRNVHGSSTWTPTSVSPGGTLGGADPQLANDGTTSSIVAQAPNGEIHFWWKPNASGTWTKSLVEWANIVGNPSFSRDATASHIAARMRYNDAIKYYRNVHGQPSWTQAPIYLS
ncbi:hypothetical protein [Herbidospora sp. NBRC 101105]|uniref:hypothetical protein n=1 Tax=Herbidospora sp. NBRC 101105 TaxID=3032195 RepID=UPI0024A288D6|nr:hypothetical protein [Herbidospora sp. NBRC 101105]GLX99264.1 hypothetical protein Hesp01_72140 [Herbidospora sp. NBRC 101105]